MRRSRSRAGSCGLAVVLALAGVSLRADGLDLAFREGRVTLVASEATLDEILDAWAVRGGTRFVDAERLTGPPLSLHLVDVPEIDALRILLRNAAGYVASPRAGAVTDRSRFDQVIVMPTSGRAASARRASPARGSMAGLPAAQRGPRVMTPTGADLLDDPISQEDALETLRELLPEPFTRDEEFDDPSSPTAPGPTTAPRPGMPVEATDDTAPVFIRPVRPQPDDR